MKKDNILKNGFFNAIKTLSSILFPLITVPYISRILGVENLGKINFSNSYISYFTLIASLGITTYAMRECSKVRENRNELERTASELLSINICTMIIAYILLGISLLFVDKLKSYELLITIYSFTIVLNILGTDWINMAMGDFKYIAIRTVLFQLLSLLLMLFLIHKPNDYIIYACIMVFASNGSSVVNIIYRRKFCRIRFILKMNLKKHMKPIFLLFSLLLAQSVLSNLDITMLGFILSDVEVGYYSMAVKLYITVEKVISSIAFVLIPQLTRMFTQENYKEINKLLKTTNNFIISCSVPFSLGLCFLSKEILVVVCGSEYAAGSISLSILSISMFVNLLGASFWGNVVLLPSGKESQFMVACIISAIINAITNYLLIPKFGIVGAAITTLFSTCIILIICKMKHDPRLNVNLKFMEILPPLLGGMLIIFVCLICKSCIDNYVFRIIISVLFSALSYFTVLRIGKNEMVVFITNKISDIINKEIKGGL